ncbi:type II toxin-antitoxin system ParD family antitoxin [Roseofilum sp. BLCC_M154]|uniref:Type II toxin-antitoxin system ParD family antitoxin n=1 Tax=Roseofilum acuticapitatum BLCC-M154 TaxID=3022444 RepID=A0ABT7ATN1_9CYAN|nr:type II toxin-antitoxin system ParD family antitoxin [Roseofilum acuticapitatum]MDJ1169789.1 type II toxin-antitoxin system ParD family antitoxin [Roseofilum acuticapitatum BLCC-M154]
MNVTLKSEQAELIQQQINSGKYQTPEEVIAEALQLLDRRDREYENWVEETRQKVDIAIEELRQGEGIDGEVVIAQLKDKLKQSRLSRKSVKT